MERKVGRRAKTILSERPGIGAAMEEYAKNCGVGADKWRRTGVLTFDGNTKVEKKLTFQHM